LIFIAGTTPRGNEILPITFSIIEFAFSVVIPPLFNAYLSNEMPVISSTVAILPSTVSLWNFDSPSPLDILESSPGIRLMKLILSVYSAGFLF